ncbi:MAG: hypothetical protein AAB403_10455, partial [Planctomycetota bacterium]
AQDLRDRVWLDLAAAVATDAVVDENGNVGRSLLQMVNGGKRQNFIRIMRELVAQCTPEHIRSTLFGQWQYGEPMVNLNLRWDPRDDRRHAYRWDDPSDASTRKSGCQLGANRLAIEALPLFPVCAIHRRARTVGFAPDGERFIWPIWIHPASLEVVRGLLTLEGLHREKIDRRGLKLVGIAEIFCARRFAVDKFQTASFSTAESL